MGRCIQCRYPRNFRLSYGKGNSYGAPYKHSDNAAWYAYGSLYFPPAERENLLFLLETQPGITRGARKTDAWDWNYNVFRKFTKQCNGLYTDLVYLERRLQFASGLSKFLLSCLSYLDGGSLLSIEQNSKLCSTSRIIKENIQKNEAFLGTQLEHVLCLQKRCQSLITVVKRSLCYVTQNWTKGQADILGCSSERQSNQSSNCESCKERKLFHDCPRRSRNCFSTRNANCSRYCSIPLLIWPMRDWRIEFLANMY